MKQFEAAREFLNLVLANPDDFVATHDSGRDHSVYKIRHNYRNVSMNISEEHGGLRLVEAVDGQSIMFGAEPVLQQLHTWAKKYIADEKIRASVRSDNSALYQLTRYYAEK